MIKEIVTETAIVDLDNYPEEIEVLEGVLDTLFKLIGYRVYRLKTYKVNRIRRSVSCTWLIVTRLPKK
jgi:hypothetical protein